LGLVVLGAFGETGMNAEVGTERIEKKKQLVCLELGEMNAKEKNVTEPENSQHVFQMHKGPVSIYV
jgi:hypothetical protein